MPFRCRWAFPRVERCLLDHLSPFGTSCSPSFSPSKTKLKKVMITKTEVQKILKETSLTEER
jgi:hypothetical protein